MAYKSLYRAYRPQVFDDVSGQEAIMLIVIMNQSHVVNVKAVRLLKMVHTQM
nr:hypothetical protein [uncultured Sharpea sp.]